MKLWRFGKHNKANTKSYINSLEPNRFSTEFPETDFSCIWLLVCTTFNQILPKINLYLCVNEHGEIAQIALPDLIVSMTWGKIIYEYPNSRVIFFQQINQDNDKSFLVPAILTDKQTSSMSEITHAFNKRELARGLKKYNWQKILSEITAKNSTYLNDKSFHQRINRIKILDNHTIKDPDDFQEITGYTKEIPIFLYTSPDTTRVFSKQEIQRELFVRQSLCEDNIETVRKALKTTSAWGYLNENDVLIHVINRAEVELKLKMQAWPSFSDIMLNPEMSEFVAGPPPELKFTPKAQELLKNHHSRELGFCVFNWGEPDIAHITLHLNQSKAQSYKDNVTSPASTIFRDDMGFHTLVALLYRINTTSFSLSKENDELINLDAVPTSRIPEINWKPISEEVTHEWWQNNIITKKILWLATYNLASHLIGDPEEVICSITPIGDDVIQVSMLFDNLEAGAPYAFAIIRDEFSVRAIPVFPQGTYDTKPDGSLISRGVTYLKNYCITLNGERIDIQATGHLIQFIKPIYTTVISGKYKQPPMYELRR